MSKAPSKSVTAKPKKKAPVKKTSKKRVIQVSSSKVRKAAQALGEVLREEKGVTPSPKVTPPVPKGTYLYSNGKRKTSISTVRLFAKGSGKITINGRSFENYFPVFTDQDKILSPLKITSTYKMFDILVRVHGGGVHSQAEAVRHGIAKALLVHDPLLRTTLKPAGYLTRDSRIKERKKYGLKRARRAPQFSKR